jgi:hypothetical protein
MVDCITYIVVPRCVGLTFEHEQMTFYFLPKDALYILASDGQHYSARTFLSLLLLSNLSKGFDTNTLNYVYCICFALCLSSGAV